MASYCPCRNTACSALDIWINKRILWDFPSASNGKVSAYNAVTWFQSLGWEDPLKKGMATHPSILAWRIPWTEEPDRLHSAGLQRVRHD